MSLFKFYFLAPQDGIRVRVFFSFGKKMNREILISSDLGMCLKTFLKPVRILRA